MKTAADHFKAGDIQAAVTAALEYVRNNPADRSGRFSLAELLVYTGDLERADKQLDVLAGKPGSEDMLAVMMLRQLLRAETTRREVWLEGRAPEFLLPPGPAVKGIVEGMLHLREGKMSEAMAQIHAAEESRPKLSGTANGNNFEDFRDLDDLCGPFMEVLTGHGKYYWLPLEQITSLVFEPPVIRMDLVWRRAKLNVRNGPDGDVFIPALYINSHADEDNAIKLGRKTDYRGADNEPTRGFGQREFLVGEDVLPIMELTKLEFSAPTPAP